MAGWSDAFQSNFGNFCEFLRNNRRFRILHPQKRLFSVCLADRENTESDDDDHGEEESSNAESESDDERTVNATHNHNNRKRAATHLNRHQSTSKALAQKQKISTPPLKKRKMSTHTNANEMDILSTLANTKQSILREVAKLDEVINDGKLKREEEQKERDELQSKLDIALQANERLRQKLRECKEANSKLQSRSDKYCQTIEEYKEQTERHKKEKTEHMQTIEELKSKNAALMKYDLDGYGLNEEDLNRLEMKFHDNIKQIKEAKNRLVEQQLYCVACNENKKNVAIIPCNHVDLCEACESSMERKICPRCNTGYQVVFKLNI